MPNGPDDPCKHLWQPWMSAGHAYNSALHQRDVATRNYNLAYGTALVACAGAGAAAATIIGLGLGITGCSLAVLNLYYRRSDMYYAIQRALDAEQAMISAADNYWDCRDDHKTFKEPQ